MGREMSPVELDRVMQACDMTLALDKAKRTLTDYVQSRMNLFAPNLTALIGSLTAAQPLTSGIQEAIRYRFRNQRWCPSARFPLPLAYYKRHPQRSQASSHADCFRESSTRG